MLPCAELFNDLIKSKGLHCDVTTLSDGKDMLSFPYEGQNFKCIFSGDKGEYLSLRLFFETVPDDKYADVLLVCNALNAQFKWVKFYIDKDNDIALEDDALLSIESAADETFELLLRMIGIFKDAKPAFMKAIYA